MLRAEGLTKTYGRLKALSGVSFSIGENEIVGLLGPNGAGKSTTMKLLTGYIAPTSGTVYIDEYSLADSPKKARGALGYLPEQPPLYIDMTVREHLSFVCSLKGIKKAGYEGEIKRVAELLNIGQVLGRAIRNLSKGYRQRVGLAAAIVGSPRYLILDEPTSGLDPGQVIELRKLILRLSEDMSIIISSHVLSEIDSLCGRIIILNRGQLLADGALGFIQQSYRKKNYTELGLKGGGENTRELLMASLPEEAAVEELKTLPDGERRFLITTAAACDPRERLSKMLPRQDGVSLLTLSKKEMSLEDLFLDVTKSVREVE